jgi:hypothetical protein
MVTETKPAQGTIQNMMAHVDVHPAVTTDNIRRRYCFLVQWSSAGDLDLVGLHQTLTTQLNARFKRHCCLASYGNGTIVAFILKSDTARIREAEIELPDCRMEF